MGHTSPSATDTPTKHGAQPFNVDAAVKADMASPVDDAMSAAWTQTPFALRGGYFSSTRLNTIATTVRTAKVATTRGIYDLGALVDCMAASL